VRQLVNVKDLSVFQRFLRLCASRVGQIFNAHSLSSDLGVSGHTIKSWVSILEASFLVILLQPYFENFGKRLIKSPKLYFTDVGLVSYLLGIESHQQVNRDPLRGSLVENLVVMELVKNRLNHGLDPQLYYYRDSHGNEVDIIYKQANELVPIEIKAAQTITQDFFKGLKYFQKLAGERCKSGYLIYSGDYEQSVKGFQVLNFRNARKILENR
jgi:uncharacterized protein